MSQRSPSLKSPVQKNYKIAVIFIFTTALCSTLSVLFDFLTIRGQITANPAVFIEPIGCFFIAATMAYLRLPSPLAFLPIAGIPLEYQLNKKIYGYYNPAMHFFATAVILASVFGYLYGRRKLINK